MTISATPAGPGVQVFTTGAYGADGTPSTQAGSHPYAWTSAAFVNTVVSPVGILVPAGEAKTIAVGMPPGFFANPTATPGCTAGLGDSDCPLETQVGVAGSVTAFGTSPELSAVHTAEAPFGRAAKFTFSPAELVQISVVSGLRSDEDHRLVAELHSLPQIKPLYAAFFTFWGVPADPAHDELRCAILSFKLGCGPSTADRTALLVQPADCAVQAAQPPVARLTFDTWQAAGNFEHWQVPIAPVTGCEKLTFATGFSLEPGVTEADSPSAFGARLTIPSAGLTDPDELATPALERAVVELPAGVSLNASVADGLAVCSGAQIGLRGTDFPAPNRIRFSMAPDQCPGAAKIGTAELRSGLLERPLSGTLFLAAQGEGNPFGSRFALYLVIEDPVTGIVMKLPGEVAIDQRSGQISVAFQDLPQIPLSSLKLDFKGGGRSLLATPSTCGEFAASATSTPWSAPESGPPVVSFGGFTIDSGPDGSRCASTPRERPFDVGLSAGTVGVAAGEHAPFALRITRSDGSQELNGISVTMPPGLAATLRGVVICSGVQLAGPSCPAQSQVGTVTLGSGVGPSPFYLNGGRAYLAGPYRGAPLSLALVVPVLAGPFDLGVEVVRAALRVDPETARITIESDPLPQIFDGVPAKIRDLRVDLDRPGFTRTPTSCEAMSITGTARGASGAVADLSTRFQVGGCATLGFRPRVALRLFGAPTRRGGHPQLRAVLRPRAGDAAVRSASILLPRTEYLDNSHIQTVCTRERFAVRACPAKSVYGHAKAWSPLLDEPLQGPVYLRSSDGRLPDLVASLDGQIRIDLAGHVDATRGRIRISLPSVPDVPVSKFELTMQGGRKGLLVNNTQLCRAKPRAAVSFRGHNGKGHRARPAVKIGCGRRG